MSAHTVVSEHSWRTAQRALIAMGLTLLALIAVIVALLVVRPSATAAPPSSPVLHAVDDTCLGARPGSPC